MAELGRKRPTANDTGGDVMAEATEMREDGRCGVLVFQLPIPLLVASVSWRMKTRGWKQGHRELATTPTGSHQSLSSLPGDANNHHQEPRAGNEYGAVTPTRNGQSMHGCF